MSVKRVLQQLWRALVVLLTPIIFLPLLIVGTKEALCGFTVLVMAVYWVTEAIPLAVTGLIPVFALPLSGILSTGDVCREYLKDSIMMFMGGLMVAVAVEHCDLHRRIALNILLLVGTTVRWIMLGFMLTTSFLSMWISNTATTAMMVPIQEAVIMELSKQKKKNSTHIKSEEQDGNGLDMSKLSAEVDGDNASDGSHKESSLLELGVEIPKLRHAFLLSIAYSASIGGTGSLSGTGPNLVLKGMLTGSYGEAHGINFFTWLIYNIPAMVINLLLAWLWLQFMFLGLRGGKTSKQTRTRINQMMRKQLTEMGHINFHQAAVLALFILVVFLWLFRSPNFIPGWADLFTSAEIDDATAAIFVAFFLFSVPSTFPNLKTPFNYPGNGYKYEPLLTWKVAQEKVPWGIILLIGGGFALAKGTKAAGLSFWVSEQLKHLGDTLSPAGIVVLTCIGTALCTEITSNTATSAMLLPVLKELSSALCVHPLYLMLPAAITCSYAFMLPVATPPNAVVYEAGHMRIIDMVKPGIAMNIICVCVTLLMINTYGTYLFGLNTYPDWALHDKLSQETVNICNTTATNSTL